MLNGRARLKQHPDTKFFWLQKKYSSDGQERPVLQQNCSAIFLHYIMAAEDGAPTTWHTHVQVATCIGPPTMASKPPALSCDDG